jgi:hypothetical protein
MLLDRSADERTSEARIVALLALALADRIVGEDHKAPSHQVRGDQLACRLARFPMAHRHQDRGMAPGTFGAVQVGSDEVAWQALEHHVLNHITAARRGPGDTRIERPPRHGKPANQREHAGADSRVPLLRRSCVLDRVDDCRARLQLLLSDGIQLGDEWRLRRCLRGRRKATGQEEGE